MSMSRTIFPLNLIVKRRGLILNYRVSQHLLYQKRCFSTEDGGSDNISNQDSEKTKLKDTLKTKAKSKTLSSKETKENAKKKLFSLLSELKVDPDSLNKSQSNLNLAKAHKRPTKQERFKEVLEQKSKTPEDEIETAAKKVAESVRGDPKETLAQLNEKLRILNLTKQPPVEMSEENMKLNEDIGESLLEEESNKNIMLSVEEVAAAVSDGSLKKSSLSQRLLRLSIESKSTTVPRKSLDDLVKSMQVDTSKSQTRREEEHPKSLQRKPATRIFSEAQFNIFEAPPLDLQVGVDTKVDVKDTVWKHLEENRLKLMVQFAPANAFEEMIRWTEQGKHWKFPIDNETEMGDEENVGFNEHVFLEEHLHGFPKKGPVRHFMELVVVGLSMNPYISVNRKIDNINWFRDYFKDKEDILKELGALG